MKVLADGTSLIKEARIDVELFGHPYAPDYVLDGTIRHPAAACYVLQAAQQCGFAVEEGVKAKAKRYPPANGKTVLASLLKLGG